MPEISARTWTRFLVTNFNVSADVMGLAHTFDFHGYNVSVKLPQQDEADKDERYDNVASISSWRADTEEPLSYEVLKVDVEIVVKTQLSVPPEALERPPKQFEYFSSEQTRAGDDVCAQYSEIADRAFQYWLGVLRWATDYALIGQPEISGPDSGWSTYILETSTNHRVWAGTTVIRVQSHTEVTKDHWDKASKRLVSGEEVPMHLRFLQDAETSTKNEQYEKAILELAMACEIYLRYSVFEFIPESTHFELKTYIEEANINRYVSKFFRSLVPADMLSEYKKLTSEISSLMSRRNSYVHMGKMDDANAETCYRFIKSTRRLFTITLAAPQIEN